MVIPQSSSRLFRTTPPATPMPMPTVSPEQEKAKEKTVPVIHSEHRSLYHFLVSPFTNYLCTVDPLISERIGIGRCSDMQNVRICKTMNIIVIIINVITDRDVNDYLLLNLLIA